MPDVSALYPGPPQPQQGVLGGDPLKLLLGITQLQQARSELVARQAIGKAYQESVGPDGYPDTAMAQRKILGDPDAAYGAPKAISDIASLQGQMASNAAAWVGTSAAQAKPVQDFLGSLGPDADANAVYNGVATLKRLMPTVPSATILGVRDLILNDPQGIQHGIATVKNIAIGPAGISQRVTGPPDAGTGAPTSIPLSTANMAGTVTTGLPPGSSESAGVMQADLARARNFGQEMFPWHEALTKMEEMQAKGQTFGPGSKGRQELESFVYALSPTAARIAGVDPEKITKYAEVEKYLTQGLQSRANNMGPHTNEGLATAATGTPNVHITDLAGVPLVKAVIGMRRFEQAQTLENSQYGGPAYTQKSADWAATHDPRAFMIDMMSPDQIKTLQKSLKGAERDRFNASLKAAIHHGLITPPGQ